MVTGTIHLQGLVRRNTAIQPSVRPDNLREHLLMLTLHILLRQMPLMGAFARALLRPLRRVRLYTAIKVRTR
eukprot:SAG31_NODE_15586_length_748_cov_0.502311_2_plen_72_part_00